MVKRREILSTITLFKKQAKQKNLLPIIWIETEIEIEIKLFDDDDVNEMANK